MLFTRALLAAAALATSASASCFRYTIRMYGLEHEYYPGIGLIVGLDDKKTQVCYSEFKRKDMIATPHDVKSRNISCPAKGWSASLSIDGNILSVTTPDSHGKPIVLDTHTEANELGNLLPVLYSADGSNGC